jgi:site-specific DNA-methyltransferase (adenine-specific)
MVSLYHNDCLEQMQLLPNGSIDCIITDPPYGTTACKWDSVIPFEPMWEQLKRVIKPNGAIVLFGSQPFTSLLICSNLAMFRYEWIWHKNYSGGFILAKKQPMKYHENILVFYKEQPTYNPIFESYSESTYKRFQKNGKVNSEKMRKNEYRNEVQGIKKVQDEILLNRGAYPKSIQKFNGVPNCNSIRLHPTQKPIALMEYLIKTYTNESETVLDFTMGSGSTGVACVNTNRNFIGIEKELKYYEIAKARIEKALEAKTEKLF